MSELATPQVITDALDAVQNRDLPLEDRAGIYAVLRHIRLRIDRALRPVGPEIQEAMAAANAEAWGPIRLSWKSVDPRYVCNDPDNWGDDGVQETLAVWNADTRYRTPDGEPYIRHIPDHFEVDTKSLGAAMAAGDPTARELYGLIREHGFRTEEGRAATLSVVEPKPRKAAA
jgi:hypothetical protein